MFRLVTKTVQQAGLVPRNRVYVSRPFSLSSSTQGYSDDPIIRREQYDRRNARRREKYASDLQYQAKRKLMESERIRARRAKSNKERHFQSTRRRNFQIFVKNRIRRGDSTLWWRKKEDGGYDMCIVYERARCCMCSTCFMKEWSRVSPLGHEHRTFTRKRNPNQETASEEPTSDLPPGSEPESESTSKSV